MIYVRAFYFILDTIINISMSRSRSRSWERRRPSFHSNHSEDLQDLPKSHCHQMECHSQSTFTPNLKFGTEMPQPNDQLGDHELMNQTKSKIDPYYDQWDKIKFLLNPYELIDIYRRPE